MSNEIKFLYRNVELVKYDHVHSVKSVTSPNPFSIYLFDKIYVFHGGYRGGLYVIERVTDNEPSVHELYTYKTTYIIHTLNLIAIVRYTESSVNYKLTDDTKTIHDLEMDNSMK